MDFDTTKNLFIEGDNLEALKLLQETYLGKVKMIYIDPPYNTGNDFIYEDDFAVDKSEFELASGVRDEQGNKLFNEERWKQNSAANGRFHSDWLSMIYSRLKLARNLLKDDGSIVISIDDAEYENLKKCADEIFGHDNYLATLVWDKNRKNDAKYFSVGHEYMLIYSKSSQRLLEDGVVFREPKEGIDEIREFFTKLKKTYGDDIETIQSEWRKYFNSLSSDDPKKLLGRFSKIDNKGPFRDDGNISWPGGGGPKYDVIHPGTGKKCKVPDGGWRYGTPERFWEEVASGKVVFGPDETTLPRQCRYLFESEGQVMRSVHYSYAQTATMKFNEIMGQRIFENPKSYSDIQRMIRYMTSGNDVVVDFFAGSATSAHSAMAQNAEDGETANSLWYSSPNCVMKNPRRSRQATKPSPRSARSVSAGLARRFWKANVMKDGTRISASASSRSIPPTWLMSITPRTPSTSNN
ncbi:MAG: site-specific DNA-methyltransferase [Chlorobium sp.]|nr:site-specific DNA-methyltransferase [Chlorobium sp.]